MEKKTPIQTTGNKTLNQFTTADATTTKGTNLHQTLQSEQHTTKGRKDYIHYKIYQNKDSRQHGA